MARLIFFCSLFHIPFIYKFSSLKLICLLWANWWTTLNRCSFTQRSITRTERSFMAKRSLTRFIFSRNIFLTSQFEEIFLHTSIIEIPYFFCLFKTAPRMYTHLSCFTSPQKSFHLLFCACSIYNFPLALINFSVQSSRDRARDGSRKCSTTQRERFNDFTNKYKIPHTKFSF